MRARLLVALAALGLGACNSSPIFVVVQVTPPSLSMAVGATDTVRAQATQLGYGIVQNALIGWTSSDPSIATVAGYDSVAYVTAVAPGSTSVVAQSGGSASTVAVTVLAPTPAPVAP
ncbi:MAG TPA: Ig-like domain-containing protein [Gemmatimonadales bacterium]|nr:Ig-like domain-containing protein [Gemmatimonadales bacterium]